MAFCPVYHGAGAMVKPGGVNSRGAATKARGIRPYISLSAFAQFIGDEGDEFAVGGAVVFAEDLAAEQPVYRIHQATLMACRMARSTLLGVVWQRRATPGYSSLVMRLITSWLPITIFTPSRRY